MTTIDHTTVDTYDRSAKELAEYFAGIGSRVELIEKALKLAGSPSKARVVEVGCGDGRDAADIVPRVEWYEGFDPSIGLIELARQRLPGVSFVQADALSYKYPESLDVVFGFASFLHLGRESFHSACEKVYQSLRDGGILMMTLKLRDSYQSEIVEDEYGKRLFYYYDEKTVRELVKDNFEVVEIEHQVLARKTKNWLLVVLRKNSSK